MHERTPHTQNGPAPAARAQLQLLAAGKMEARLLHRWARTAVSPSPLPSLARTAGGWSPTGPAHDLVAAWRGQAQWALSCPSDTDELGAYMFLKEIAPNHGLEIDEG